MTPFLVAAVFAALLALVVRLWWGAGLPEVETDSRFDARQRERELAQIDDGAE